MTAIVLDASDLGKIERGMQAAPELVQREQLAAMHTVTGVVKTRVQDHKDLHNVTGTTSNSIQSDAWADTAGGVMGYVGSTQISMVVLEEGSKPHKHPIGSGSGRRKGFVGPPRRSLFIDALEPWVQTVLGLSGEERRHVAFLIARKISIHGREGKHVIANTFADLQGFTQQRFEQAAQNIADGLAGGMQ